MQLHFIGNVLYPDFIETFLIRYSYIVTLYLHYLMVVLTFPLHNYCCWVFFFSSLNPKPLSLFYLHCHLLILDSPPSTLPFSPTPWFPPCNYPPLELISFPSFMAPISLLLTSSALLQEQWRERERERKRFKKRIKMEQNGQHWFQACGLLFWLLFIGFGVVPWSSSQQASLMDSSDGKRMKGVMKASVEPPPSHGSPDERE